MTVLEKAKIEDADICYSILDQGRAFQREQGFVQWSDKYSNPDTVKGDIAEDKAFVIKYNGDIAGYMRIDFDGDPEYATLEGEWHTNGKYAVVHRMAIGDACRGFGLAHTAFALIEDHCLSHNVNVVRVDTDFPNKRMQHILEKTDTCVAA